MVTQAEEGKKEDCVRCVVIRVVSLGDKTQLQ